MTKSEISEAAWRRAAKFLESDVLARDPEVTPDDPEYQVLRHIEKVVIPSILQRANIIRRNRRHHPV